MVADLHLVSKVCRGQEKEIQNEDNESVNSISHSTMDKAATTCTGVTYHIKCKNTSQSVVNLLWKRVGWGTGTASERQAEYHKNTYLWEGLGPSSMQKERGGERKLKRRSGSPAFANWSCIPEGASWRIVVLTLQGYCLWGGFRITPSDNLANI